MSTPEPRIVHEDEALAGIEKPAGLVVHPAPSHSGSTLVELLGDLLGGGADPERPGIVHRLDKDTSGVMVVAKTDAAHRALSDAFADHGSSGSPVFDRHGHVIGLIASGIEDPSANIVYVMPSDRIAALLRERLQKE